MIVTAPLIGVVLLSRYTSIMYGVGFTPLVAVAVGVNVGGVVGVIIDCRGRPLVLPEDREERVRKLTEWNDALGVYPNS